MRCHDARILMTRRLYEPLARGDGAGLARHLEECASCREEYDGIARLVEGLRRMADAEPAPAVADIPVDVAGIRSRSARSTMAPLRIAGGLAALACGAVAAGLAFRGTHPPVTAVNHGAKSGPAISHGKVPPPPQPHDVHPVPPRPTVPYPDDGNRGERPVMAHRTSPPPSRQPAPREQVAADRPSMPDEAYLDGNDPELTWWFARAGANQKVLELIRKRLPKVQDDFVRVPFPWLAAADTRGAGLGDAVRKYEKEARVVDTRLFENVTLQLKATSLDEFCSELGKRVPVRFRAARGVRDEKVTVFVKDKPTRDVMRAVARLFGYGWVRSGEEGDYRYELVQDLRSQLAEQEMRNQDTNAALLALDEKMGAYRPYLELSPAQVEEKARAAQGRDRELLRRAAGRNWSGMQVYHRLTPLERAALAGGEPLRFSSDSTRPDRRLPEEWRRPLLEAWGDVAIAWSDRQNNLVVGPEQLLKDSGLNPTRLVDWPGASVNVALKIDRSELGELLLQVESGYVSPYKDSTPGAAGTVTLATGQSPSVVKPDNALPNRGLRSLPLFTREVSLHPKPSCPVLAAAEAARKQGRNPETAQEEAIRRLRTGHSFTSTEWQRRERDDRLQQPHVTTADVWEELHRRTGMSIVADSYTRLYPVPPVTVEKAPLFDALCKVSDEMRVRWKKDGEFLLCRSTSFFWDKLKEVPNRLLEHWRADREQQGGLPFADLLELAGLSDSQLDSRIVGEGVTHCWGLREWDLLGRPVGYDSPRPWLRLLAELPEEKRLRTLQPEGLPVGSLTPQEQQGVAAAMGGRLVYSDPIQALQGLANWRVRVDYAPAGFYAWTPVLGPTRDRQQAERLPVLSARTAEAALALARKIDASVGPDEIERTDGVLTITLLMPDGKAWAIAGERAFRFRPPEGK